MSNTYYKSGDWKAECDVCGQEYKASKLKLRWDGLRVCPKDFEFRHPQDFVRGIRDRQSVPFTRPEAIDSFIPFNWTQYPNESVTELDYIVSNFTKTVNPHIDAFMGVNSTVLNALAVNSSVPYTTTVDDFSLSDSVSIGSNKIAGDNITNSETFVNSLIKSLVETITTLDFIKFNDNEGVAESIASPTDLARATFIKILLDSITPSETVSFNLLSSTSLNGSSINKLALG